MDDSGDGDLSPVMSSSGDELFTSPIFRADPVQPEEKNTLWAISNNPEFYAPRGLCLPPLTPNSSHGRQHRQSPFTHSPELDAYSQMSHDDAFSEASQGPNHHLHMEHLRAACHKLDATSRHSMDARNLATRSQQGDGDPQTLKRQLSSLQDTNAGFKADIAAMTVEKDRLYAEVKVLQARLAESEGARRAMREQFLEERSELETRIELLKTEKNTRVAKLNHENAALQYRVQELTSQIEGLSKAPRHSIGGESSGVGSMRMDHMREERDQLKEQLRAREVDLDKRAKEVQEWACLRAETAERASKLAEENSSLSAKLAAATLELSQLQQQLQTQQLVRDVTPGAVALDELVREKQQCEKAAEDAYKEVIALRAQNDALEQQLQTYHHQQQQQMAVSNQPIATQTSVPQPNPQQNNEISKQPIATQTSVQPPTPQQDATVQTPAYPADAISPELQQQQLRQLREFEFEPEYEQQPAPPQLKRKSKGLFAPLRKMFSTKDKEAKVKYSAAGADGAARSKSYAPAGYAAAGPNGRMASALPPGAQSARFYAIQEEVIMEQNGYDQQLQLQQQAPPPFQPLPGPPPTKSFSLLRSASKLFGPSKSKKEAAKAKQAAQIAQAGQFAQGARPMAPQAEPMHGYLPGRGGAPVPLTVAAAAAAAAPAPPPEEDDSPRYGARDQYRTRDERDLSEDVFTRPAAVAARQSFKSYQRGSEAVDTREVTQYRDQVRQLTQDVAMLTDSLAAKTRELAEMQLQRDQDEQDHQEELAQFGARLEDMARERAEIEQRLADTEQALMDEREMRAEDIRRKESTLEALGAKVVQLTNSRTEAIEKLQDEKARLEMALRAELESQVGQLQSVNDQLAAKLSERTQEVAQLRDQMEKSAEAQEELSVVNKQLLGKVADLAQSLTELKMANKGNPAGGNSR